MRLSLLFISCLFLELGFAQTKTLPIEITSTEQTLLQTQNGLDLTKNRPKGTADAPPFNNLRTMAEWEEIEALTITWTSYPSILKQIVAAAMLECEVIILSENINSTQNYLAANNAGGAPITDLSNITIIDREINTIWMRDYAANTVYVNDVGERVLVDWIYNRPRPDDDVSPEAIADEMNINLYETIDDPEDLVNTGGNFMSDGFGTAFASELILEENEFGNPYNVSVKDEAEIDAIMLDYMGLTEYIKMTMLPYDGIHHIDMHMKLLDEKTLLVGEYPIGVADGPQIEENLQYVLNNFTTKWGTPFDVIRIPMPPEPNFGYPDVNGYYNTYANAVFVNKTILLPLYYEEYDTTALRIWEEAMPGYNIVGIDVDNNGSNLISQGGAIHCITHSVGVENPLLISHNSLNDMPFNTNGYPVEAFVKHASGIQNATLYYTDDLSAGFSQLSLSNTANDDYLNNLPAYSEGTTVYYYIGAEAVSGKQQVRPIVAPEGYWSFKILDPNTTSIENQLLESVSIYPNPVVDLINVEFEGSNDIEFSIIDTKGSIIKVGQLIDKQIDVSTLASGAYVLKLTNNKSTVSLKFVK